MRNIILFLIPVLLLAACKSNEVANSKDVSQNTIYQEYSISYTEDENITWVRAAFRFGGSNGTTLVLSPPSRITFNGDTMRQQQTLLGGASYVLAYKKPLENGRECEFVFTATDSKNYTNKLKFNPVLMGTPPAEVQKGLPYEIPLITAPLTSGEKIRVTLKDTSHHEDFIAENFTDKQIIVPANVLKDFNGKVVFEVARISSIPLQQSTGEGGSITFEYVMKSRYFTIVP